jgi:hypothetical protein
MIDELVRFGNCGYNGLSKHLLLRCFYVYSSQLALILGLLRIAAFDLRRHFGALISSVEFQAIHIDGSDAISDLR